MSNYLAFFLSMSDFFLHFENMCNSHIMSFYLLMQLKKAMQYFNFLELFPHGFFRGSFWHACCHKRGGRENRNNACKVFTLTTTILYSRNYTLRLMSWHETSLTYMANKQKGHFFLCFLKQLCLTASISSPPS